MKRMLGLNLGVMILLTFAVGCGGNSSDPDSGGASSSAGNAGTANGNAGAGGASAMPGGGAHSSAGQTSMPGTAGAGTGGAFSTSVPGSTPLKDLTPEQFAQLCSDLQKYVDGALYAPLANYQCKLTAVAAAAATTTDAAAQTACKSSLAACMPDTNVSTGMCDNNVAATCTATVADASLCVNDTVGAITDLVAAVPGCDGLTPAQAKAVLTDLAANGNGGITNPPSCEKYNGECPSMSGMP